MRHTISRLVILTALSMSSTAFGTALLEPCSPRMQMTLDDLTNAQASQTFKTKFSRITPDIAAQSKLNLLSLRNELTTQRDLSKSKAVAKAMASAFLKDFVVEHSTSHRNLLAILKSGALLSKDELVRRGLDKPNSKNGLTNILYDGAIGEQDVVYLAYQARSPSESYHFGDVTFLFDTEPILETAYLTLNSFTVGAGIEIAPSKTVCDRRAFDDMVRSYRSMVFEGRAHRELVELSAANALWLEQHRSLLEVGSESRIQIEDYKLAMNKASLAATIERRPYTQPDFPAAGNALVCQAVSDLNQNPQACSGGGTLPTDLVYNALSNLAVVSQESSLADKILRSFAMFPPFDKNNQTSLFRQSHWYWEVKVPRRLGFEHLQAIVLPIDQTAHTKSRAGRQDLDLSAYVAAIRNLARSKGWRVKETQVSENRRKFTFEK